MNISLPQALKSFVDAQVSTRGYSTSSEYVRELIRREQSRERLRGLLEEGAASPRAGLVDADYFDSLRASAPQPSPSAPLAAQPPPAYAPAPSYGAAS